MTTPSPVAASSQSDGRWKIAFVPSGSNPKSVAILAASPVKDLTYSFVDGGFKPDASQATVEDKRLTLIQNLSRPGKVTETLAVQYVDSTDAGSAAVVLTSLLDGFFVVRRGISNDTDWTVAQKVDIYTVTTGIQRPDAPVENGRDTISQDIFITAPTQRGVALVA